MKAAQDIFNWQDTIVGTTVDSQAFIIEIDGSAPVSSLSTCTAIFTKDGATTITAPVTITSASLWHVTVGPITASAVTAAGVGTHEWKLTTTDANGRKRAYVGGTLKITDHV